MVTITSNFQGSCAWFEHQLQGRIVGKLDTVLLAVPNSQFV